MKKLPLTKMKELADKIPKIGKLFQHFSSQTMLSDKTYPLDFIMSLPRHVNEGFITRAKEKAAKSLVKAST